jgi:hypothetical protein
MRMLPPEFSIGTDEDGKRTLPLCAVCNEVIDIFNTNVTITSPEENSDHMYFYHPYHREDELPEYFPLHHVDTFTPPPSKN